MEVTPGFTGTLTTDVDGLLASTVETVAPEAAAGVLDGVVFFEVPLHIWNLGDTDEGNLTLNPSTLEVKSGVPVSVTASWKGLAAGQRYLGQVNFLEGGDVAGSTLVTVNP